MCLSTIKVCEKEKKQYDKQDTQLVTLPSSNK